VRIDRIVGRLRGMSHTDLVGVPVDPGGNVYCGLGFHSAKAYQVSICPVRLGGNIFRNSTSASVAVSISKAVC
jgi:hypothetical protein